MKDAEKVVERLIFASRWLQVPLYLGLFGTLVILLVRFAFEFVELAHKAIGVDESHVILGVLTLVDLVMVANLIVMVVISGYENFVSRFDTQSGEVHWLGTIDVGSLKIKVASTIVAISSIHLLQIFLNHNIYTAEQLMWLTIMHLAFVLSALLLAYIDRIMAIAKGDKKEPSGPDL